MRVHADDKLGLIWKRSAAWECVHQLPSFIIYTAF